MIRDITDKIVVITGATDGMGLATAEELAKHGPRLVLIGRNIEKGRSVVENLIRKSGNQKIDFLQADLSSQADIRKAADEFKKKYDRLDILINNAGAYFPKKLLSADGLEMTFALNHLGYFLLTNLLLETIEMSAPARIINISSMAHSSAKIDWDDINMVETYHPWLAYANSKLMNLYFTYELAKRLAGTNVTVNAVHPGLVNSKFGKQGGGPFLAIFKAMQRISGKTSENGAKTAIYLALSDEVDGVNGEYFADEKQSKSSKISHDTELAKKLWDISTKETGL